MFLFLQKKYKANIKQKYQSDNGKTEIKKGLYKYVRRDIKGEKQALW